VPSVASFFLKPIKIDIPIEFTSEAELLKFLVLSTVELKKIGGFAAECIRNLRSRKARERSVL
jgi:RNA-directed DNA polymerase